MKNINAIVIVSLLVFATIFFTGNVIGYEYVDYANDKLNNEHMKYNFSHILWSKTYGGRGRDNCWSLEQTADGGFVLIGETTTFDTGGGDVWMVKVDSDGSEEWNKTYGGSRADYGFDGVQTTDGGYVIAGGTKTFSKGDHDTWIVRTDEFGNELWNKSYGGLNRDQGYAILQSMDGGFLICGGSGSFTEGPNDYWVIKTDNQGEELWNLTFGDKGYDWGYDIIELSDGTILFTGGTDTSIDHSHVLDVGLIAVNSDGTVLWNKAFNKPPAKNRWDEGYSIIQTGDAGFLLGGIAHTYHWYEDGEGDGWIIKTNEHGEKQWERVFGGDLCDGISTVIPSFDGGFVASGWTYSYGAGDADIWLLKLDEQGYVEWDLTIGKEAYEWSMLHTLELSEENAYMIAGTTKSYGRGTSDMFLAKIQEPSLTIDFASGIGFSFQITNNGENTLSDLNWSIDISKSILLGVSSEGTIDSIAAGESRTISSKGFLVGLGTGSIRFSMDGLGKTVHCLFVGPLVIPT